MRVNLHIVWVMWNKPLWTGLNILARGWTKINKQLNISSHILVFVMNLLLKNINYLFYEKLYRNFKKYKKIILFVFFKKTNIAIKYVWSQHSLQWLSYYYGPKVFQKNLLRTHKLFFIPTSLSRSSIRGDYYYTDICRNYLLPPTCIHITQPITPFHQFQGFLCHVGSSTPHHRFSQPSSSHNQEVQYVLQFNSKIFPNIQCL